MYTVHKVPSARHELEYWRAQGFHSVTPMHGGCGSGPNAKYCCAALFELTCGSNNTYGKTAVA
jgi:hypothetical protein